MRQKKREISVLSIAAVDVFASTLGVFIIISAVALPFLFRSAISDENLITEIEAEIEEKQEYMTSAQLIDDLSRKISELLSDLQSLTKEMEDIRDKAFSDEALITDSLEKQLDKMRALEELVQAQAQSIEDLSSSNTKLIPAIDVVFLLDTTGSMTNYLRDLQSGVFLLSRILVEWSEAPAVGLVEILDQCDYQSRKIYSISEPNSTSLRQLKNFVYSLGKSNTRCNQDLEEGIHLALKEALALNWRKESEKRVIVIISDHTPYKYKLREVESMIVAFISMDARNTVSVVHPDTNGLRTVNDQKIMRGYAELGRGEYVDTSGSFLGSILLAIR